MQVTLPVWVRKEAQAGRNQSSDDGQAGTES